MSFAFQITHSLVWKFWRNVHHSKADLSYKKETYLLDLSFIREQVVIGPMDVQLYNYIYNEIKGEIDIHNPTPTVGWTSSSNLQSKK